MSVHIFAPNGGYYNNRVDVRGCKCVFGPTRLKTQKFLSVSAFRPHVSDENGHRKRKLLKTLSKVETFENGVFVFSCGHLKTELFENDDVKRSNSVLYARARFSQHVGLAGKRSFLLGLISSLIAFLQLNVALLNLQTHFRRRHFERFFFKD